MRVGRAFAFIDLCGFTAFNDAHGDDDATRLLAEFRAAVRDVSSSHGVRVGKWLGDGAMFVSTQSEPLVHAVLEVERRVDEVRSPLALRAGITEGDVILFEGDDYVGSPVNLAARLSDLASPHEILMPAAMATRAPAWATVSPPWEVEVRGFIRPVSVVAMQRREHPGQLLVDPVCGMQLRDDEVVARRTDTDGTVLSFCSDTCAAAWEGVHPELAAEQLAPPA